MTDVDQGSREVLAEGDALEIARKVLRNFRPGLDDIHLASLDLAQMPEAERRDLFRSYVRAVGDYIERKTGERIDIEDPYEIGDFCNSGIADGIRNLSGLVSYVIGEANFRDE